jgi:DNA-binding transcriptional ArsR family regulator
VSFAYSPAFEAALSLHVVAGPKHHPLQHGWVRHVRRLPTDLRRRIDAFNFAWRTDVPDFLLPSPEGDYDSFEAELVRMRELEPLLVGFEFLRPMWDHAGDRDPAKLADPAVRAHVETRAERLGGDPALAALLFDDPAELLERFLGVLADYWEAAFAAEWERVEPQLADAVVESGRQIAAGGVYAMLPRLARRLRVDPAREEFGLDLPHHHWVEVTERNKLTLVPSLYVWPHVRVNCDEPFPLTLVYPAPSMLQRARPTIPDAELLRLLRALGDDTRLRALRLIAEAPRSTQELAPLVGLSEAGLSKHLRLLADAGVLATRRDGYYVLYSFVPERVGPLADALLDYLGGGEAGASLEQ